MTEKFQGNRPPQGILELPVPVLAGPKQHRLDGGQRPESGCMAASPDFAALHSGDALRSGGLSRADGAEVAPDRQPGTEQAEQHAGAEQQ